MITAIRFLSELRNKTRQFAFFFCISASFFEIAKVNSKCDLISPDTIFLSKGKGNKKAWGTL